MNRVLISRIFGGLGNQLFIYAASRALALDNNCGLNLDIKSGFKGASYSIYDERGKGLRSAIDGAVKNDIVLVLGKGREEYQEVNGEKFNYSDMLIIEEYL